MYSFHSPCPRTPIPSLASSSSSFSLFSTSPLSSLSPLSLLQYVKVKETQLIRQAAEEVLQMDSQQQDAFAAMTKTADATLFVAVTEEACARGVSESERNGACC